MNKQLREYLTHDNEGRTAHLFGYEAHFGQTDADSVEVWVTPDSADVETDPDAEVAAAIRVGTGDPDLRPFRGRWEIELDHLEPVVLAIVETKGGCTVEAPLHDTWPTDPPPAKPAGAFALHVPKSAGVWDLSDVLDD